MGDEISAAILLGGDLLAMLMWLLLAGLMLQTRNVMMDLSHVHVVIVRDNRRDLDAKSRLLVIGMRHPILVRLPLSHSIKERALPIMHRMHLLLFWVLPLFWHSKI